MPSARSGATPSPGRHAAILLPESAGTRPEVPSWGDSVQSSPMGLMHCPLCIGLAVLSAMRFSAHAWMVWRRFGPLPAPAEAPLVLA